MRWLLFFIFLLFGTLLVLPQWHFLNRVYPNTFLGTHNVGYKTREEIAQLLKKETNKKLKVKVRNRTYTFSYKDLGIEINKEHITQLLFEDNSRFFAERYGKLINALYSQKTVLPRFIISQEYYQRLEKMHFDFSVSRDEIVVDASSKTLLYKENEEVVAMEPESLKKELLFAFGTDKPLNPQLYKVTNTQYQLKASQYNQQLARVTEQPVQVIVQNSRKVYTVLMEKEDLRGLVTVLYQEPDLLIVGTDENILRNFVATKINYLLNSKDLEIDLFALREGLTSLFTSRLKGYDTNRVQAFITSSSNTHGTLSDRYIEVDISQQKMYLWEQGRSTGTYRISSGLYYPTPPGSYQILNKALNAYSSIYHVWMPYWMAFYMDPKVNAYLGIHELPYWIDTGGQEIRRPRDFIGSPHTGGCVSLDITDASTVYAWAQVGTPVVIYE